MVKMLETLEILRRISVISSLENDFSEVDIMKRVICPACNSICMKYGKNKSGSQRWFCNESDGAIPWIFLYSLGDILTID